MPRPFLTVVEPPVPAGGDLPRMDVAALAGFAEAGPFGVPVCVESTDGFAAVFGRPMALPGGPGRLASAAAAFFAQGGRRAWVVRCGDAATAAARFPLPGVIAVLRGDASPDDDRLRPAELAARSAGTFVDDWRISTAVQRERIVVAPLGDSSGVRITAADGDVAAGRLVELPLLRDGAVARRMGVLTGPNAVTGVFRLASSLTVMEAPALPDDLAGHVGELAARMARDAAGRARITIALAPGAPGAPAPTAVGRLVRFDPEPVRPPLPARALRAPEPPTWVLVDDVSAPPAGAGGVAVVVSGAAVNVDRDPAGALQAGVGAVLALELSGRALAADADWRLSGLGCTPGSPAWPGELPTDAQRYAEADGLVAPASVAVCGSGLEDVAALVPILPEASGVEAAPVSAGGAAARNGLAETVRRELLGRRDSLVGTSVAGLGSLVAGRDRAEPAGGALPGILAMLDAPEATLLAVPDAVAGEPPGAVEADPDPERLPPLARDAAAAGFGMCAAPPDTPALADAELRTGGVTLSWVVRPATTYEVGLFADAGATAPARILYRGVAEVTGSGVTTAGDVAPVFGVTLAPGARGWARVRAFDAAGRPGGWSTGVPLPLPAPGAGRDAGPEDATPADLRALHGVLLRMAALRGDALAILSVPPGWSATQVRDHSAALQEAIGEQERHVLAFGTLAHPWPRVPSPAPEVVRPVPADAALAGQLAAMAATRGAWIAVSDRPLRDAVDTTDAAGDRAAAGLRNRYVTGVRGVSADGQDTLALDADDRPVNVRRLLALVRRAALERGRQTVFEPNGPTLWRALHRDMDGLLALLHERGAFRPARATDAYRVDVFGGDARGDDGRCICEMRVAPSVPLRFLTVRLERQTDGTLTTGGS